MNLAETNDQWQKALEEKKSELQKCQKSKGYKSCLPCPEIDNCTLRDAYVKAVYESMNRGKGGGFEF